jgi:hypothetical protein
MAGGLADDLRDDLEKRERARWLLSPWGIALVLLGAFLLYQGWQTWRDRALYATLNEHPAFATPPLPLEFSRNIKYDPLTFVGRGARAGFWEWTPQGLNLTEQGRTYFEEQAGRFISQRPAGHRRVTRIRWREPHGPGERIEFFYEWTDLSPVAVAVLRPSPVLEQEFLGFAVVVPEAGGWRVESLTTQDFDEPLARVQDVAAGILR